MLSIRDFGVTFSWQGTTVRNIATLAQEAESLGFGHFWVPEAWGLESFSTTAYLLALTKKIRIGTGVVNVFSRSAALIGMACATLDQISLGRFMLGIGTSGRGLIERWHKAKFERPLCRTLEYIDDIRRVSRGLPIEQSDSEIGRGTFRLFTSPMGKDIEIYIGAIGDRNLKLAGEHADGAILAQILSFMLHRWEHIMQRIFRSLVSASKLARSEKSMLLREAKMPQELLE
jgi:alkanesulfonate monooxygenase SsuD/methylene tetrahydromethanopterin reductase-like flavin-dependent oxidoreductase (luciferase family)